ILRHAELFAEMGPELAVEDADAAAPCPGPDQAAPVDPDIADLAGSEAVLAVVAGQLAALQSAQPAPRADPEAWAVEPEGRAVIHRKPVLLVHPRPAAGRV